MTMAAPTTVRAVVLIFLFSAIGCGQHAKRPETHLTRDEAIRIAEATARAEGYDLRKYSVTGCHYDPTETGGTWRVCFGLDPADRPRPGEGLLVVIDEQSKKAELMAGE